MNMKLLPLQTFYMHTEFSEHNKIKRELLQKIKLTEANIPDGESFLTDWNKHEARDFTRPYVKYILPFLKPYINEMIKQNHMQNCKIHNIWFQQYEKGDEHKWHIHPETNWTNVYYVEMMDNMQTELYDTNTKNIHKLNVKEGDLISFPAHIIHRAPRNTQEIRKTIISFNTSFDGDINIDTN